MGNSTQPRINEEDLDLMRRIAKHGFVDMVYIYKFYKRNCKPRTVDDRITQLEKYDYLYTIKMFQPPEYVLTGKTGYRAVTLGTKGLQLMRYQGFVIPDYVNALKKASPYRTYHQVQVATVCDYIQENYEYSNSKFIVHRILNEREACLDERKNQTDAMIIFKSRSDEKEVFVSVMIEMERSYARVERIESKLKSYYNSFHDKSYSKLVQLPLMNQRVLFVSQTDSQFNLIKEKIEKCEIAKKMEVLVVKYSDVCKHTLEKVYIQPFTEKKAYLLSNLK